MTQQVADAIGLVVREPVGVVGIITPWNFPLLLVAWKLAPALAAGCTAVCKPSHFTPGSTLELGRLLLEAGAPAGVFNVVTSAKDNGAVVGQALARSPRVDKIAFTGSTATGREVAQAAASTLKRVSLELGGKSPNVVFADVHSLDAAVTGAFFGVYMNSGQVCQAGSRLLVQESIKDQFVEKLVAMTRKAVRLGDPSDPATTMGPLINRTQLDKVLSYIDAGRGAAELLLGGGRPSVPALQTGLFVEPTIFDRVDNQSRIAQEEIFGPVLSVMSFKDAEDALRIANQTMYGLAAAVWTRDLDVAFRLAKGIKAGTVWVNAFHGAGLWQLPYGGYKQSGLGRELGHDGLAQFLETKSIHIKLQ
jgi:aldehyde dehydrogenase (NAD+)/betaine-aldehyde dehydrogenase